jgi:hypothetical protein
MIGAFTLGLLLLGLALCSFGAGAERPDGAIQEGGFMNSTDSTAPRGPGRRVGRPDLPEIVSLTIERVPFRRPSYKFVRTAYPDTKQALAFNIEVKSAFRLDTDATPVLYVGDVELTHSESLGERRYRFLAFPADENAMHLEAPISLGWPGHRPHRQTRFRYKPPLK